VEKKAKAANYSLSQSHRAHREKHQIRLFTFIKPSVNSVRSSDPEHSRRGAGVRLTFLISHRDTEGAQSKIYMVIKANITSSFSVSASQRTLRETDFSYLSPQ
jgi:hypothetical protein